MANDSVKLSVPFTSLVAAISELDLQDKRTLLEMLEEEIGQLEEEIWEKQPTLQAELKQARVEYAEGDFISIEEYISRSGERT